MKFNIEYNEFIKDIITDKDFLELKNDSHHGSNRYEHCKRVSYLSYLLGRLFKCDIKSICRSSILHDFFHGSTKLNNKLSYTNHPKVSIKNAKKNFNLSTFEESIIATHMYHYALLKNIFPFINNQEKVNAKKYRPTSKEGYIVCIADLLVSIYEACIYKVRYNTCLYIIFLINLINI